MVEEPSSWFFIAMAENYLIPHDFLPFFSQKLKSKGLSVFFLPLFF